MDSGNRLHHFRLGVKGGEINVLVAFASTLVIVLGVVVLPWLSAPVAAQGEPGVESQSMGRVVVA